MSNSPMDDNRPIIASVIVSCFVCLVLHFAQERRIRELEAKAAAATATDEVFWGVTDKFYKLESRLR